ncbi:PepSY-associated TM helix domain-containing protein [Sphingomonas nostoxanthinifaciens]|uniref:PepSY-associated TM helix domain-containing protein n=1 Tax=Sphingomonas nostoxanthinifaciens TaxID=2872652 RepID=UPI0029548623|nr:PepSY-associated TM helix domain-containing protein [Sphingomonas nostoxanthinifaciens]
MVDILHRWTGGFIGVLLTMMGLTGAILVHRRFWVMLPHAHDAQDQSTALLAATAQRLMQDGATRPNSIIFATKDFGLDLLAFKGAGGAYADQSGAIVTHWTSQWQRPELWLFDLHHHLLIGDAGERVVGVVGLLAIAFVVTGALLWWQTRKTFAFRLLPKRMSRPAIVRWHRDFGIVLAPLLLLSFVTGTLMAFRPFSAIMFGPGAPAAIAAARKMTPPRYVPAKQALPALDWAAMVRQARARFPEAEVRKLQMPMGKKGVIILRMRQPEEWLPDGRTLAWFDPADGRMIGTQDSRILPAQVRAENMLFPLHTAGVGGLAYRLLMTLSGVSLMLLGSLTTWTFWFKRPKRVAA